MSYRRKHQEYISAQINDYKVCELFSVVKGEFFIQVLRTNRPMGYANAFIASHVTGFELTRPQKSSLPIVSYL